MEFPAKALFVGGPVNNQIWALPADADGIPPLERTFLSWPPARHIYHRTVSPYDNGPLWLYLYKEKQAITKNGD